MKVMPIMLPTETRVIYEDTPMGERGSVAALSKASVDNLDALLKVHPEVKAAFNILWTPQGREQTHLAIASDKVSLAQLEEFARLAISALLSLLDTIEKKPETLTRDT